MLRLCADLYAKRIVNVNVNIVLSGLLALIPTLAAVHFSRYLGVNDQDKIAISAVTFVADMISDVVIYYILHWLANHSPVATRRALQRAEELVKTQSLISPERQLARNVTHPVSFLRDATIVQLERMCLSPVLYGVLLGSQQYLLRIDMDRVWATAISFCVGIALTRCLHTLWMLRQDRKARRARQDAARAANAVQPGSGGANPTPLSPAPAASVAPTPLAPAPANAR
ncbi:MAG: hypothetical protein ACKVS8_08420 [Phycisphaerales bacterium]